MNTYCQIYNNKAWWIFDADSMPEFHSDIILKDISNLNPQPVEGWDYNATTDTFSAPVISTPSLQDSKTSQKQLIINAYTSALSVGFTSSASGTSVTYPYNSTAELTFDELYLRLMNSSNPITYPQNVYDINNNAVAFPDQAHLSALYNDIINFKATLNTKMHGYLSQIDACTDVISVQAIIWS